MNVWGKGVNRGPIQHIVSFLNTGEGDAANIRSRHISLDTDVALQPHDDIC